MITLKWHASYAFLSYLTSFTWKPAPRGMQQPCREGAHEGALDWDLANLSAPAGWNEQNCTRHTKEMEWWAYFNESHWPCTKAFVVGTVNTGKSVWISFWPGFDSSTNTSRPDGLRHSALASQSGRSQIILSVQGHAKRAVLLQKSALAGSSFPA